MTALPDVEDLLAGPWLPAGAACCGGRREHGWRSEGVAVGPRAAGAREQIRADEVPRLASMTTVVTAAFGTEERLGLRADAGDLPCPTDPWMSSTANRALQLFGDPELALTEAARVLVPGGRLGLAVWRSLRDNPAFADFVEVLPHHLAPTAVASLRAPFSGPDRSGLIALLRRTGFDAIHSRIVTLEVRFTSPRTFFEAEALGSPLAGPVTALGRTARDQLTSDVERRLARHTDDDGRLLAMQTWLVDARREVRGQRD